MRDTKCKNCGGPLVFSPQKGALVCEHCDSVFLIRQPVERSSAKILRKYTPDFMPQDIDLGEETYFCNNCNTTHRSYKNVPSTRCPSCGSKDIKLVSAAGPVADGILPFKLTKEQASEIFEKWLKKRKFAPNDLKYMAKGGKISKVYVPVYNINATSVCFYSGQVKTVHTDKSTDTIFSTQHYINDVDTTSITRVYSANSVVDEKLISKIAQVDPSQIVPYSSEYLAGYLATQTDITIHEAIKKLTKAAKEEAESSVRAKLHSKYDEIVSLDVDVNLKNITFNWVYLPVFMNHYNYKNKHYHCYISGQNGKVEGRSPKSAGKILALIGSIAMIVAGVATIVMAVI